MEKRNLDENNSAVKKTERTGEDLLQEYYKQDKDIKHYMGKTYYVETHSDNGDCCC